MPHPAARRACEHERRRCGQAYDEVDGHTYTTPHLVADVDIAWLAGHVFEEPALCTRTGCATQTRGRVLALPNSGRAHREVGCAALGSPADVDDGDVGLRRRQQAFSMQLDAGAMHASLGVSLGKYESYPNDAGVGAHSALHRIQLAVCLVGKLPEIQHRLAARARLGAHVACGAWTERCGAHELR